MLRGEREKLFAGEKTKMIDAMFGSSMMLYGRIIQMRDPRWRAGAHLIAANLVRPLLVAARRRVKDNGHSERRVRAGRGRINQRQIARAAGIVRLQLEGGDGRLGLRTRGGEEGEGIGEVIRVKTMSVEKSKVEKTDAV